MARSTDVRWSRAGRLPADRVAFAGNLILGLLVVSLSVSFVAYPDLSVTGRFATGAVACGCFGALFVPAIRAATLTRARVLTAVGVLVGVAVATGPRASLDVWSYVMYGRMLSVHHANPFLHGPAAFRSDPLFHLVSPSWRHTPSVYGPGFVALAGLGTAVAGHSVLLNRLFFQGLEAVALVGALALLWRRTKNPVVIGALGLNPAVLAVVNGGHNDLVVGFALLVGVLLVAQRRWAWAGLALAGAASIKLVVLLPIVAVLAWVWRRQGARPARLVGGTTAIALVGSYVVAGGLPALQPLLHASAQHDQMSIWELPRALLGPTGLAPVIGTAALALITVLAGVVVVRVLRPAPPGARRGLDAGSDAELAVLVGATTLVFLLGASFVLPWYSAWALPVLALAWRSRVALVAVVQAGLVLISYAPASQAASGLVGVALAGYVEVLVPLLSGAALAYLVWSASRDRLSDPVAARRTRRIGIARRAPARVAVSGAG